MSGRHARVGKSRRHSRVGPTCRRHYTTKTIIAIDDDSIIDGSMTMAVPMPNLFLLATMASLPPLALASSSFITTSSAFLTTYRSALRNNRNVSFVDGIVVPTSSSSAAAAAMPPSKGDLYNDDELFELLTIHQTLNNSNGNQQDEDSGNGIDDSILGGVHDWVLQTLNDDCVDKAQVISTDGSPVNDIGLLNDNDNNPIEIYAIPNLHKFVLETIGDTRSSLTTSNDNVGDKSSINQLAFENLQTLLRDRKPSIRAIATGMRLLYF